jgi:thioredoxin 1
LTRIGGVPTFARLRFQETIMATSAVTDANFATDVLAASQPVVVDFWAEWCGPCKMIGPHLEEISGELAGKVKIVKLNVDENQQTAIRYGVRSIPTLIMFKGGEPVDMKIGASPKSELQRWIQSAAA